MSNFVKTTGTEYESDEVIGFVAVNENGEILMDKVLRPVSKEMWYEKASNPKLIRSADVLGVDEVDSLEASIGEIEAIIRNAKSIAGRNLHFQLDMLHACHADIAPDAVMNAEIVRHFKDADGNDAFVVDVL